MNGFELAMLHYEDRWGIESVNVTKVRPSDTVICEFVCLFTIFGGTPNSSGALPIKSLTSEAYLTIDHR